MNKLIVSVVCDAGPIIHLDELNCLNLLYDFQEILLPDTVWNEVKRHRPSALQRSDQFFIRSPGKTPANERLLTMCRIFALDAGEIEALALMEDKSQSMFLTDDASARLVAEQIGFKVHGSIGILVRSIRRGQMIPEDVLHILTQLPLKSTLHIKQTLLDKIQLSIKKEFDL